MYTDTDKHTYTHIFLQPCALLAASLLSRPSITVPTGAVNILYVLRPVLFLAFTLNGRALKISINLYISATAWHRIHHMDIPLLYVFLFKPLEFVYRR